MYSCGGDGAPSTRYLIGFMHDNCQPSATSSNLVDPLLCILGITAKARLRPSSRTIPTAHELSKLKWGDAQQKLKYILEFPLMTPWSLRFSLGCEEAVVRSARHDLWDAKPSFRV